MIKLCQVSKAFLDRSILDSIDLEISSGKSLAIIGRSGEGKSTLLHVMGTLETPDHGELVIDDTVVSKKNADDIRKNKIGFIFQNFNVLEDFSVIDNLNLASQIRQKPLSQEILYQSLEDVDLREKAHQMTRTLSGGEKQRLAIARALVHKPKIVLADEPTGSLDQAQGEKIQQLLLKKVTLEGALLIIVTHDLELAKKCDRILQLKDGKLNTYL